jgi:hypothetical protein
MDRPCDCQMCSDFDVSFQRVVVICSVFPARVLHAALRSCMAVSRFLLVSVVGCVVTIFMC